VAIGGLVLVGTAVLWATSGLIKAVFVGLFKIAFYGVLVGLALYAASRFGGRFWRQAYGRPAPWEGAMRSLGHLAPSARSVMTRYCVLHPP
jgi:hypothetical protein